MADDKTQCPICNFECTFLHKPTKGMKKYYCQNCGNFYIENRSGVHDGNRHIVAGYLYEKRHSFDIPEINREIVEKILLDPLIPKTSIEKLNKLLLSYYKFDGGFSLNFNYADVPPAAGYAINKSEIDLMLKALVNEGYLATNQNQLEYAIGSNYRFTLKGLQYCESLISSNQSKTVFVAMKFNEEMKSLRDNSIKPACEECGFTALTVDETEHNGDITDKIITEIKTSHFVISDFTENNLGVYYEAGYAKGLGLNVIKTCKKSWFDETDNTGNKINKLHFDIDHDNLILWDDEDDLKERLVNRIKATIL